MKTNQRNGFRPSVVGTVGLLFATLVFGCSGGPNENGNQALTVNASPASLSLATQNGWYTSRDIALPDGRLLQQVSINAPPVRPDGFQAEAAAVDLPKPDVVTAPKVLTVPAYKWSFGAAATAAAMIAGYYDQNGFANLYIGPTGSGVAPLDSSVWPTWTDGTDTYDQNPLAASRKGLDGRSTKGSIDDYWVVYGSTASDPYITGSWTQHTWSDAIGDYMKTSQSAYGNSDGATAFWNYTTSANKLTCADMESYGISTNDGTYGRKLFYEARGYAVAECYSQKTDNQVAGGFSFANYKAEIDAGRPVLLNLAAHQVVGTGYDVSGSTVYLHDTFDYLSHTMTWGGSYSGMALQSVSIVNLVPRAPTGVYTENYTDRVRVYWTASTGATSYQVYRNASNSSSGATLLASPTSSPFDDTTAAVASIYYYFVKACIADSCSDYSASASGSRSGVPANDSFDSATPFVVAPFLSASDTTNASVAGDDPALTACSRPVGARSVWYSFTPSISRTVYLDTFGSDYDTMIGVFTGTRGNLVPVACNDDDSRSPGGLNSALTLNVTAGTTYRIVVYAFVGSKAGAAGYSPQTAVTVTTLQFHATTFYDVPGNHSFWRYIEGFYAQGITSGCGTSPFTYCPDNPVTRASMAVFLLRTMKGSSYVPPSSTGIFADLPVAGKEWMQPWVEEFYREGITSGCATSPLRYCPETSVTRAAMAVFVLRSTKGVSYVPPTSTGIFADLPVAGKEWMQPWVEEFYREGITSGCAVSPFRYCPENPVNRGAMATFVSRAYAFPQLP